MGDQGGIYIDRAGFDPWYREMRRVRHGLRDGLFDGEELAVGRDWRLTGSVKLQETIDTTTSRAQEAVNGLHDACERLLHAGLAVVEEAEWQDGLNAGALHSILADSDVDL
ncbi:MAG: hypothetical protein ACRDTU_06870 [Micromonosporaceae bacterium]